MLGETFFKKEGQPAFKQEKDAEIVEKKLEKIRKALEVTLRHLESDPNEREGELMKELIRRKGVFSPEDKDLSMADWEQMD